MSDGPKIIRPFEPPPHSKELAYNATRWMQAAKKELPRSVGCIMIFFPKEAIGEAKGITVGNVPQEALLSELKSVVRRWTEQRRIIDPSEF